MLWSVDKAAKELAVSPRTIRRLLNSGKIARVNVMGAVRIQPESVEAFVARNTVQVDNSPGVGSVAWKGNDPCYENAKARRTGGQTTPMQAAKELDALLEQKIGRKLKR